MSARPPGCTRRRGPTLPRLRYGEDEGRRALLVDGTVQSVDPVGSRRSAEAGYWGAMVPSHRPSRALLLGLGGGTVARLLHTRFGTVSIVGVDDDPTVIELAGRELADLDGLEVVRRDAFDYVASSQERFDLACVDLYRGAELEARIVGRPFLRQLRDLLFPRGLATFNLFVDRRTETRIRRIERYFRVLQTVPVGKNLVVWCR